MSMFLYTETFSQTSTCMCMQLQMSSTLKKRTLFSVYRASFCQTFSEMKAQGTGEWKSVTAGIVFGITLALWIVVWLKKYG